MLKDRNIAVLRIPKLYHHILTTFLLFRAESQNCHNCCTTVEKSFFCPARNRLFITFKTKHIVFTQHGFDSQNFDNLSINAIQAYISANARSQFIQPLRPQLQAKRIENFRGISQIDVTYLKHFCWVLLRISRICLFQTPR